MLDNNRSVAQRYASFIMPGDVLAQIQEFIFEKKNERFETLIEYVHQMFLEDSAVRLEQAGSVSDRIINIRNVYTDLDANATDGSGGTIKGIAKHIISLGNHIHRDKYTGSQTADFHYPEHRRRIPKNNIVLIGNAGQGKSTLCQYICQIYRAALIKRFMPNEPSAEGYFSEVTVCVPQCERFPVLINLKQYAAWINSQGENSSRSVIGYILSLINKRTNATLSISAFRHLLSCCSWIFLFDGLDEVPASSNRVEVLSQIRLFMENYLIESSCDSLIICTSRPQGYDDAFSSQLFNHYTLQDMTGALCKNYIDKLLLHMEENGDARCSYQKILDKALADPMVSKLMTTPLYTAIIVLLVRMGGTPPTKRYALFQQYCEIIIRREQQKETLPLIHDGYDWIKDLHARLGFLLQAESETKENAAAELSTIRCKEQIRRYLTDVESNDQLEEKTCRIYQAITTRLSFLSEVTGVDQESCVVFPLRSIQEYFAAEQLIESDDENNLSTSLELISVSSYWRNVYLFVAGYFAKNRNRKNINDRLYLNCLRNNCEEGFDVADETEAYRITLPGSFLALDLLCDNIFDLPSIQRQYLNKAALLFEHFPNDVSLSRHFLHLPERIRDMFLYEYVIPYIHRAGNPKLFALDFLWTMAKNGNEEARKELKAVFEYVSTPSFSTVLRLLNIGYDHIEAELSDKIFQWLTGSLFFASIRSHQTKSLSFLLYYLHESNCIEEPPVAVLRHLLYQTLLQGPGFLRNMEKEWRRFIKNNWPLVHKIVSSRSLFVQRGKIQNSDALMVYSPIVKTHSDDSCHEYAEIFETLKLGEMAAFIRLLNDPSYSSFILLLEQYKILPDNCKSSFLQVIRRYNWLLAEIAEQLNNKDCATAIPDRFDQAYWDACLNADAEITSLVEANDLITVVRKNYFGKKVGVSLNHKLSFSILQELLNAVDKTNINPSIFALIWSQIREFGTEFPELNEFVITYSPLFSNDSFAIDCLLQVFNNMPVSSLVSSQIGFPQLPPEAFLFISCNDTQLNGIISKINTLAGLGGKYLQAYAFLPCIFGDLTEELLSNLTPITLSQYHEIKETKNKAALQGAILCALSTPLSEEWRNLIREDLNDCFSDDFNYYSFRNHVDSFGLDGKLLVYEIISTGRMADKNELLMLYQHAILESLQSTPVDKDQLVKYVSF